jgi:hypothetical protein
MKNAEKLRKMLRWYLIIGGSVVVAIGILICGLFAAEGFENTWGGIAGAVIMVGGITAVVVGSVMSRRDGR